MKKSTPNKKFQRQVRLVDIDDFDVLERFLEDSDNQKMRLSLMSFDASIRMSR